MPSSNDNTLSVLITGGAGFIGSHLAERLLNEGHAVTVIDDLSTGRKENIEHLTGNPKFRFVVGSIMDETLTAPLVHQCDVVYHLAAAVGVFLVVHSPVRTIETTASGTETILKLAWMAGKKVMVASSSEVYGKRGTVPFRESDDLVLGPPDKGRWSYACSKLLDEFLALAYHRERRYGMVLPRFVGQALDGGPITVYGNGEQTRSFTHVLDAIDGVVRLMNSPEAEGNVFNVGSDREISIRELAETVRRLTNPSVEIEYIPYDKAYSKGFEDLPRRVPDISRAGALAGYEPTRSIEQIIEELARENE